MKQEKWALGELFSELSHMLFTIFAILLIPALLLINYRDISFLAMSSKFDADSYAESTSPKAMAYLSAEASYNKWYVQELYKRFMPVTNNYVSGWIHATEDRFDSGLEWALWVNKYDINTYALVYSGTDEIKDFGAYIDMELSNNYCQQMYDARTAAKSVRTFVINKKNSMPNTYGAMKKLYITGHSLGGYLASFIASELVDSYYNPENTYSDLFLASVSANLDLENVHCTTFGAPGMYLSDGFWISYGKLRSSAVARRFGDEAQRFLTKMNNGVYNTETQADGDSCNVHITNWETEKLANQRAGRYNGIIKQYVNDKDMVGNLVKTHMWQLGTVIINHVQEYSSTVKYEWIVNKGFSIVSNILKWLTDKLEFLNIIGINNKVDTTGDLYYHMIWIYAAISKS